MNGPAAGEYALGPVFGAGGFPGSNQLSLGELLNYGYASHSARVRGPAWACMRPKRAADPEPARPGAGRQSAPPAGTIVIAKVHSLTTKKERAAPENHRTDNNSQSPKATPPDQAWGTT